MSLESIVEILAHANVLEHALQFRSILKPAHMLKKKNQRSPSPNRDYNYLTLSFDIMDSSESSEAEFC